MWFCAAPAESCFTAPLSHAFGLGFEQVSGLRVLRGISTVEDPSLHRTVRGYDPYCDCCAVTACCDRVDCVLCYD